MQNFQYDVFISYSHKNTAWVSQVLLPRLQNERIYFYYDADFEAGIPSLINMEAAVENSRKVILVLTPEWVQSDWSIFESVLVQTTDPIGRLRRLIPLLVQPCQLPSRLSMLTYIDLTLKHPNTADFELQMQRLIATIRQKVSPAPSPQRSLPPITGELNIPLPPLPIQHPDWQGGLKLDLKEDIYLLTTTKEQPIEKYEAEDKGSLIWQARAMQLNKQSRQAWLKQAVQIRDSRSSQAHFQALRTEYSLLDQLSYSQYLPQSIDLYEQDDAITLAYKYPPGKTLAQHYRLTDKPLDPFYFKPFLRSLLPLCDMLDALHHLEPARAHRLLSPTTILILPQRFEVAILRDLGLAAFPVRRKEGPAGYQAPEQIDWGAKGELPGPRTDIYQLAAIIYRVLTGLPVHSPWNILSPHAANPHVSEALDAVLLRALAPDISGRWPRIDIFKSELKRVVDTI